MSTIEQDYAVLVLCARDVDMIFKGFSAANLQANPTLPAARDPNYAYVTAEFWTTLGQLRCDDMIISKSDNCYYGLLLQCQTAVGPFQVGDLLAAVRGTMQPLEWIDDALAELPEHLPGRPGSLAMGFWDIYASMTFADMAGQNIQPNPATVIAALATQGAGRLFVVGHSLGAALATYLAADLQVAMGPGAALSPYFFASPRVGTSDYVDAYQAQLTGYDLVNYSADLVPNVPTDPPFATLNAGGARHNVFLIPNGLPGAPPSNIANNHSAVTYARLLDPQNVIAQRFPIP